MVYWSRSNYNLLNLILPSSLIIFPPSSVFSSVSILDFNILSMHLYIELLIFLFCILYFLLSTASSDSSSPSSSLLDVSSAPALSYLNSVLSKISIVDNFDFASCFILLSRPFILYPTCLITSRR